MLTKRPYERRLFSVSVRPAMRDNDQIATVLEVTTIGDAVEPPVISDVTVSNPTISFLAIGGAVGTYTIRIRWTTASHPEQRLETLVTLTLKE